MAEEKKTVSDLKWLVIFAALMVLPWILLLGWMGFLPAVSNLVAARAPLNLGVKYAATDLESFEVKSGISLAAPVLPPAGGKKLAIPSEGSFPIAEAPKQGGVSKSLAPSRTTVSPKPLEMTISQEELSAVMNRLGSNLLPLREVQVKLGPGSAEISGALDASRLSDFLENLGVRPKDAEGVGRWVNALGDNIPIHLKANGGVVDAQLSANIESLEVGGFNVPAEQLERITKGGIHADLSGKGGYSVQTLTLQEGNLKFIGALPPSLGSPRP